MEDPRPLRITKSDPKRLSIEWSDGLLSSWTAPQLRNACACAHCVDELTGSQRYDTSQTSPDLTTTEVRLMGHYALAIEFSDNHATGIFPFRRLRELHSDAPVEPRGDVVPRGSLDESQNGRADAPQAEDA